MFIIPAVIVITGRKAIKNINLNIEDNTVQSTLKGDKWAYIAIIFGVICIGFQIFIDSSSSSSI